MSTKVSKNKRILNDHGEFEPYRENVEASQKVFARAGVSPEELERENKRKRLIGANLSAANKELAVTETLSDQALEAELARRAGLRKPAEKPAKKESASSGGSSSPSGHPAFEDTTVAKIKAALKEAGVNIPDGVTKKQDLYDLLTSGKVGAEDLGDDDDEDGL